MNEVIVRGREQARNDERGTMNRSSFIVHRFG
jgi:hypothetical protein